MLLFIGGAARTGKSILARRLLAEKRMPYLSLDVLKMGLARGVPEFAIDPDAGNVVVGERLWPLVREMSMSLLMDDVDYVFEGELLPKHVAALRNTYPLQVKACFLGYTDIDPAAKLRHIRTYGHYPNNWASEYTDEQLLNIITREIAFSRALRDACATHQLRYFDTSQDLTQTLERVMTFVTAGEDRELC